MTKLTEQEIARRELALENAIASQRLEGLEPDAQTLEDLKAVVRGEFGIEESIRRVKERVSLGQFKKG
ncbi:MAG: antitoxin VbhA family protein [Flavisolibacter sp.]